MSVQELLEDALARGISIRHARDCKGFKTVKGDDDE